MTDNELRHLFAGPARRTGVSPIARTLEIADRTPGMISFACGNPATEALPLDAIATAAAQVVRQDTARALQYVRPRGVIQAALGELLARDGITAEPAELLPTTGAIQALSLVGQALIEPGDIVITEYPTYPVNLATFKTRGARVIGIPLDDDGMRTDLLARALERLRGQSVKLIYVIPDSQNPSGISLTAARRQELALIAGTHGVPIIEDAPYRGVLYDGEPVPPIHELARSSPAQVVYVGSFAKIIAPGLRVGYLLATPGFVDTCVMLKQGEDFCTSGLTQLIVEQLIRNGTVEQTVARLQEVQGAKLTLMLDALAHEFKDLDGVSWTRPRGGLFVWLTLPRELNTDALLERAIGERVAFIPGRYFYPPERVGDDGAIHRTEPPTHELRLNFSDPPPDRIAAGIATLARLVRAT